jgi:site-specific recombinase XerD
MHTITLEKGLATFLNALSGKNRSAATIRAYSTDIAQFISFLQANNLKVARKWRGARCEPHDTWLF